jgi:excisionase family DNA binding protein
METVADGADPSQVCEKITDGEGTSVQASQPFAEKTKSFATHLLPDSGAALPHGGAGASPAAERASGGERRAPNASVAPTLADLRVLWGGRDRLLRVAEVAEHLGVSNATVYGLCERGELPYVWVVTSMRIRPRDLEEFIASRVTVAEAPRSHRKRLG